MRERRFIGAFNLTQDQIHTKDRDIVHQITRVLRLKEGDEVVFADGKGSEALSVIEVMDKDAITVRVLERKKSAVETASKIVLYCAILKRENFEWVAQKATELGVTEIVPVITRRTIKLGLKMDRLQAIVKEATEQSGRALVPVVREPISFEEAVKQAGVDTRHMFLDQSGAPLDARRSTLDASLWIGPEGGWAPEELAIAKQQGWTIVRLGDFTLRAETAAIAALAIMMQTEY